MMPRRQRRRRAVLAAVAALSVGLAGVAMIASGAPQPHADAGRVTTNDGRVLEGEVTDNGQTVVVNMHGVSTTIDKDNVVSIDYSTFADRFRDRLAGLADGDIPGRLALAQEALGRNEYDLSFSAIDSALAIDPLNRDARRLANFVTRQMTLDQASTRAAAAAASTEPTDETDPLDEPGRGVRPRGLNVRQINRLRQLELQPGDRVRVRFLNNVRKRFCDAQAGMDIRAFIRRDDTDQALQIITRGTRDMVDDVQMISDPSSIQTFGKRIHVALLQGCATSGCHGGDGAGDFRLLAGRPNAETTLTNYYLVMTYRRPGNTTVPAADVAPADRSPFAGGAIDLVDRTKGERSLLYQYVLPRQYASSKHPVVRGWDGIVRTANDRLARDIVEWMNHDIAAVRPDYADIDFHLPVPRGGETSVDAPPAATEAAPIETPAPAQPGPAR